MLFPGGNAAVMLENRCGASHFIQEKHKQAKRGVGAITTMPVERRIGKELEFAVHYGKEWINYEGSDRLGGRIPLFHLVSDLSNGVYD